jgi:cytoskeleton protein RodZ
MSDLPQLALPLSGRPVPPIPRQGEAAHDSDPQTIGEVLTNARQRSGKPLTQFSLELKIASHHLIAIESNAFHELPGRAYAIGFLKSYATRLGLDSEALVARLRAEMGDPDAKHADASPPQVATPVEAGGHSMPDTRIFSPPECNAERNAPLFARPERAVPVLPIQDLSIRPWIMAGIMVAAVVYFGYSMISSAARLSPPPVAPVPERLAETGHVPRYTGPSQPFQETAKQAPIAHEPAFAMIAKAAPPPVATTEEQARIARDLSLAPAKQPVPPAFASVEPLPPVAHQPAPNQAADAALAPPPPDTIKPERVADDPLPRGESYGEQNRGSRITLRVHRATLIAVLGTRNHVFIDRILRPGDTYHVPNMSGLKLNAADGGAVELMVDNRTIGFAGEDGVAAKGLPLQPRPVMNRPRLQD